jgi:hypothetical protein
MYDMTELFHNYELDFLGHSIVTCNSKGIIVETALPYRKYIGKTIDELDRLLHARGREKGSTAYKGMKDLGKTINSILQPDPKHIR